MPELEIPRINAVKVAGRIEDLMKVHKMGKGKTHFLSVKLAIPITFTNAEGEERNEELVVSAVFQGELAQKILDTKDNAVIVEGQFRMGIGDFRDGESVVAIWVSSLEILGTVDNGLPF